MRVFDKLGLKELGLSIFKKNEALNLGSSKHGMTRLASVCSSCVEPNHLLQ
jgi:hypothetical protein